MLFIAAESNLNISQDVEALKIHASGTDLQLVHATLPQVTVSCQ